MVQQGSDLSPCGVDGAFVGLSQHCFELGEDLLDRVQVWTVGRQEDQVRASLTDGLAYSFALVAAEVVHDHDVALAQRGRQDLFDIGQEPVGIDWPVQDEGRGDLVASQSGEEGQGLAMAMGNLGQQPLSASAAAVGAGHVGLGPGFVDEDQASRIKTLLVALPAFPLPGHVRPILLGGVQAFF